MLDVDATPAGVRVGCVGTTSVRYDVAWIREEDDEAAALGHFVHLDADRATRRP